MKITIVLLLSLMIILVPTVSITKVFQAHAISNMKSPMKHGYLDGVSDGQRSARDSTSSCQEYNSTADTNACFKGYDLGFKIGCENNHDRASYYEENGEYPSCYGFFHH